MIQAPPATEAKLDVAHAPESEEQYQARCERGRAYREYLLAQQQSNSEQCDTQLLTLSSALLGVSLVFIKDIVPLAHLTAIFLLVFSWIMFGLSMAFTLSSYWTAQSAIDAEYTHNEEVNIKGNQHTRNRAWDKATRACHMIAVVGFLCGVLATIWFASTNLIREQARMRLEQVKTVPQEPRPGNGRVLPKELPAPPVRKPAPAPQPPVSDKK